MRYGITTDPPVELGVYQIFNLHNDQMKTMKTFFFLSSHIAEGDHQNKKKETICWLKMFEKNEIYQGNRSDQNILANHITVPIYRKQPENCQINQKK